MFYDPNYRNQFFYDSSNSIGIREAFQLARRELSVAAYKTKMPKTGLSKVGLYSFLGVSAFVLIATALIWIFFKSALFTIVLFVIMAFASIGIIAIIYTVALFRFRRRCSVPVEATCIGYSISGGADHDSGAGRISRSPVFEYEYQGARFVAFDGMYDNFSALPAVSQKTTILIDPSDPEEIVWNFGRKREKFLILAAAFAVVLGFAMLFIVLNDENFMNSAFHEKNRNAAVGEMQSEQNSESGMPSSEEVFAIRKNDDGRIILDDAYLRNEVFTQYPDSEYVVKKRKVTGSEVFDDGEIYAVYFEVDPDFYDAEWFFSNKEATEEVKNVSAGDEFIYAQIKEEGAAWIFSTREYVLEDN